VFSFSAFNAFSDGFAAVGVTLNGTLTFSAKVSFVAAGA
jgi:hypothetical protein